MESLRFHHQIINTLVQKDVPTHQKKAIQSLYDKLTSYVKDLGKVNKENVNRVQEAKKGGSAAEATFRSVKSDLKKLKRYRAYMMIRRLFGDLKARNFLTALNLTKELFAAAEEVRRERVDVGVEITELKGKFTDLSKTEVLLKEEKEALSKEAQELVKHAKALDEKIRVITEQKEEGLIAERAGKLGDRISVWAEK